MARHSRALPGFRLTLGFTLTYFAVIVAIPLAGLLARAAAVPPTRAWALFTDPRILAAFRVSFVTAGGAAAATVPAGLLLAWVLERYRFPGRRILDAAIDLPFALPTAVAGIALTTLYASDGWLGAVLGRFGIQVAYTRLGIGVALLFVGLPFVVRTVQPVLAGFDRSAEEAAVILGASARQVFARVILPVLVPAVATGTALAFARGLGEYGSVIFIAGNRPMVSEILPLLIVTELEQFDIPAASLLGSAMLLLSFLMLLAIARLQRWGRRADAA